MTQRIEASAEAWSTTEGFTPVPRAEPALSAEFMPETSHVMQQILNYRDFAEEAAQVQRYIAKTAILQWNNLPDKTKRRFIRMRDKPEAGTLPRNFIRHFRRMELQNLRDMRRRAMLYAIIQSQVPEMMDRPFYFVNKRLEQISRSWDILCNTVQKEFRAISIEPSDKMQDMVPFPFAQYMLKIFSIGTVARLAARISSEPWKYEDASPEMYHDFDIRETMLRLINLNDSLKFYPELLRVRATSTVEAWILLPDSICEAFLALDDGRSEGEPAQGPRDEEIPVSFISFIHESNSGIGLDGRNNLNGQGGSGKAGGGGGTAPVRGPMPEAKSHLGGSETDELSSGVAFYRERHAGRGTPSSAFAHIPTGRTVPSSNPTAVKVPGGALSTIMAGARSFIASSFAAPTNITRSMASAWNPLGMMPMHAAGGVIF